MKLGVEIQIERKLTVMMKKIDLRSVIIRTITTKDNQRITLERTETCGRASLIIVDTTSNTAEMNVVGTLSADESETKRKKKKKGGVRTCNSKSQRDEHCRVDSPSHWVDLFSIQFVIFG